MFASPFRPVNIQDRIRVILAQRCAAPHRCQNRFPNSRVYRFQERLECFGINHAFIRSPDLKVIAAHPMRNDLSTDLGLADDTSRADVTVWRSANFDRNFVNSTELALHQFIDSTCINFHNVKIHDASVSVPLTRIVIGVPKF